MARIVRNAARGDKLFCSRQHRERREGNYILNREIREICERKNGNKNFFAWFVYFAVKEIKAQRMFSFFLRSGNNAFMQSRFMREAIRLSRQKMQAGQGGPFGAVVVRGSKVIARGWNQVTSANDPTAHAEVMAIRAACAKLKTFQLDDCELYTSCEPCPMCLSAIYWARLKKVHYANTRKDAAQIGFDDDLIYREVAQPVNRRIIPMKQLLRGEAWKVFAEWQAKPDKIAY
jgi:tRNA(Arg) A34 adenosine deaminase TadA